MTDEKNPTDKPEPEINTPEPETPTGDDKFIAFTKKASESTERVVSGAYTKARDYVSSSGFEPTVIVGLFDRILGWTKHRFPAETYTSFTGVLTAAGHWGLVAAELLAIIFGITAAVRGGTIIYAAYGVGVALLLGVLQYTAARFLDAGDDLIAASPSTLRSSAFMDCAALLVEVAGLLFFLRVVLMASRIGEWGLIWVGLGVWALCDAFSYVAINPSLTNIEVKDDVRAGEEAIGILSFSVKTLIRIVPIAFGVGTVLGAIGLLVGTVALMFKGGAVTGLASLRLIVLCTCLPLASYIAFAFYHLTIDVLRAILILPRTVRQSGDE